MSWDAGRLRLAAGRQAGSWPLAMIPTSGSSRASSSSPASSGTIPHLIAVDYCTADRQEARRYARRRLTQLRGRPPHEIEVDEAIYRCDGGVGCSYAPAAPTIPYAPQEVA